MADEYGFWNFVQRKPFGPSENSLAGCSKPILTWFVPPLSRHSGGHINLFRFLCGLEARGYVCNVAIVNDGTLETTRIDPAQGQRLINEWYGPFTGSVHHADDPAIQSCHVAIATGWQTAYTVRAFTGARHKCYFVQDFEPYFYARSAESIFAEESYRFGFTGFTAGGWLAKKLRSEYGMLTHALGFSFDKAFYQPLPRRQPEVKHVFTYARKETPRRGWELALLTMAEVHRAEPDVRFILAGGGVDPTHLPFPAFAPGSLPLDELPDLYSQCDVALVLSLTNLSLLPLELMACGVPIVSNTGPNVDWLLGPANSTLCPPEPTALADGLLEILRLEQRGREDLRQQVLKFAHGTSWEREIDRMAKVLSRMVKLAPAITAKPAAQTVVPSAPEPVAPPTPMPARRRSFTIQRLNG